MTPSALHVKKSSYRSDIDGLRGVAVLLVVFNHLTNSAFRGGYIGVDVFFVISGYLIGKMLLSELQTGRFSLARFYERRIRRIFPALFVVLLASCVLAYRLLLPSEMAAFSRSLVAAVFSVSNVLFWLQSGYFDPTSGTKPLLHTWSLGVEEQFYIFFPLFLIAVHRWFPRRMKAALWSVVLASLALATWFAHLPGDTTAFYFAPLRAWELLLGTIASQGYLPTMKTPAQRHAGSVVGLMLILIPAITYTSATPFPGLAALPPVLGAALLIGAGESGSSIVGAWLSSRPMVFIGMISYSLYLWHWPLKVFWSASLAFHASRHADRIGEISVFLLSLVLATLSWRFVETPFRSGKLRPSRQRLFAISAWGTAAIVAVGVIAISTHGLARRFSPEILRADEFSTASEASGWRVGQCFIEVGRAGVPDSLSTFDKSVCMHEDPVRKNYLLYGDSHAADKYPGLSKVFPELNILQANLSSCPPLLVERPDSGTACRQLSAYIFGDFLLHHHVDGVLLSARWFAGDLAGLAQTLDWLRERQISVVVIGPGIELNESMPRLIGLWIRQGRPPRFMEEFRVRRSEDMDRLMAARARTPQAFPYISVYDNLCRSAAHVRPQPTMGEGCPIAGIDGAPLLVDTNHFSRQGSILFALEVRARRQLPLNPT